MDPVVRPHCALVVGQTESFVYFDRFESSLLFDLAPCEGRFSGTERLIGSGEKFSWNREGGLSLSARSSEKVGGVLPADDCAFCASIFAVLSVEDWELCVG